MFTKIFKAAQKLLINNVILFIITSFFVGTQNVIASGINFGAAFNLKHASSGKYLSYADAIGAPLAAPLASTVYAISIVADRARTRRSLWYLINPTPNKDAASANVRYNFFDGDVQDGGSAALKSLDMHACLFQDASRIIRGAPAQEILPQHSFTFKRINDTTFCMVVGTDKIVGLDETGNAFKLYTDSASIANLSGATQYHFTADTEVFNVDFAREQLNSLNASAKLASMGFTPLGTQAAASPSLQTLPDNQMVYAATVVQEADGKKSFMAVRASDMAPVGLINGIWSSQLDARFPYAIFGPSGSNDLKRFAVYSATIYSDANNWYFNPYPYPGCNGNRLISVQRNNSRPAVAWAGDNVYKASINNAYKLFIDNSPARTMTVTNVSTGQQTVVNTDFPVIDAAVGTDGTVWCIRDMGDVFRISNNGGSPEHVNVFQPLPRGGLVPALMPPNSVPFAIAVRAVGTATENLVLVLTSNGAVYISQNGKEFEDFGVTGVIDAQLTIDGTIVFVVASSLSNAYGYAWVGNYFVAINDVESQKDAAARAAVNSVGAYDDYLDIGIQIKQSITSGTTYKKVFFTPSGDGSGLVSTAISPATTKFFEFRNVAPNAYKITYANKFLTVVVANDTYSLKLADVAEEASLFYVYGSKAKDQVRVRYKDRFLSGTGGVVSLVPEETMLSFVSASTFVANQTTQLMLKVQQEKQRLAAAMQVAIDQAMAAIKALMSQLVNEKVAEVQSELQKEIDSKQAEIDGLMAQLQKAKQEHDDLTAQMDAIAQQQAAQQKQIDDKVAELTAKMNAPGIDPVTKLELSKQIAAVQGSSEGMATVLMQNAKVLAEQARQEADLMKQKNDLTAQITYMESSGGAQATASQTAFSGDIGNLLSSLAKNIQSKIAQAFGIDVAVFNTKFATATATTFASINTIAQLTGKTTDALTATIKTVYGASPADALPLIAKDFATMKGLQSLTPTQILTAFKADLQTFTNNLTAKFNSGVFKTGTANDQVSIDDKLKVIVEALGNGFDVIKKLVTMSDLDFDKSIAASFTQTQNLLSAAWTTSKNLVARILNYDVLQEQYQKQLAIDRANLAKLKADMLPKIQQNADLRAKLRTFMDARGVEQKKIDDAITKARMDMLAATTSDQMQNIVATVKALMSENDAILADIQKNAITIMQNANTLVTQSSTIDTLTAKIQSIEASQQAFMVTATQEMKDLDAQLTLGLPNFSADDASFISSLNQINGMSVSTAEGAAAQFKAREDLFNAYFAKKNASQTKLNDLTTSYVTVLQKIQAACQEKINILNGEKTQQTQVHNKNLADFALTATPVTQAVKDAENAAYTKAIADLDGEIKKFGLIISDKTLQINQKMQQNMGRMQFLSGIEQDYRSKQEETLRYQMIGASQAVRDQIQSTIDSLSAKNADTIQKIKDTYAQAKKALQEIADKETAENNRRKAELEQSKQATIDLYKKQQTEINDSITYMIAQKQITEQQKQHFLTLKDRLVNAVNSGVNQINTMSVNFKQDMDGLPQGFDDAMNNIFSNLRLALPEYSLLLDILGAKTTLSVREEVLRSQILDLVAQLQLDKPVGAGDVSVGKSCVVGLTKDSVQNTFAYVEIDGQVPQVRPNIGVLKHVILSFVKVGINQVSLRTPDEQLALTVAEDGSLSFAAVNDANLAKQRFVVDGFDATNKTFALKYDGNGKYLNYVGDVSTAATSNSARLVLADTQLKFITFAAPSLNVDEDFAVLQGVLSIPAQQSSEDAAAFKARMQAFNAKIKSILAAKGTNIKTYLDNAFNKITDVRNTFVADLHRSYDEYKAAVVATKYIDEQNKLVSALQAIIDDLNKFTTDARYTGLDDATRKAADEMLSAARLQLTNTKNVIDEQNYRVTELRKIYLQTMVTKNIEIAALEVDSRWQKFQWLRDIYLFIQLNLDVQERDALDFSKEMASLNSRFESEKQALVSERDSALASLKRTLDEKIAAAQRARTELENLMAEAKQLYDENMKNMQDRYAAASDQEKAEQAKVIQRKQDEYALLTQLTNQKYAAMLKQLELEQERLDVINGAQVGVLNLQIMQAKQYQLNAKVDDNSLVTFAYVMPSSGEIAYVTRTNLDSLQVLKGVRFNQDTRFKLIKQEDGSFAIETVDGSKRLTVADDLTKLDLLPPVNIESKIVQTPKAMVASDNQRFFIESDGSKGVIIRDVKKLGYCNVQELQASNGQRINVLAFVTSAKAIDNAAKGVDNSSVKETSFHLVNFTPGTGNVDVLLNDSFVQNTPQATQEAVDKATKFFNDNKLYNYPDLMDDFVQALSEFGQGRMVMGLMQESTSKQINKTLADISQSFMFANTEGNQLVTTGGVINLLDKDFVEPLFLEDGQGIAIEFNGKYLSDKVVTDADRKAKISFVDGNIFRRALNFKVQATSTRNLVSLVDLKGTKRLAFNGAELEWHDVLATPNENELFTFSGTRVKANIALGSRALMVTAGSTPLLTTTANMSEAAAFKVYIAKPGSFEAFLIGSGLETYSQNAESKAAIDAISNKLIDLLGQAQFDDDSKNYFLQVFGNYLVTAVNSESLVLWGTAVTKVLFAVKQSMQQNADQAIIGKISAAVKALEIPSGAYLILKNVVEDKYLAATLDVTMKIAVVEAKAVDRSMIFRAVRVGDKYALVTHDGLGGYLTVDDNGITLPIVSVRDASGNAKIQPEANQLFWLIGFGDQLMIKLGSTMMQDADGFLAVYPNLQLAAWDLDHPDSKPKITSGNTRTKFKVQLLDEYSIMRGILQDGVTALPRILLEGLMAAHENTKLSDEQKSLLAQQKLQEFEEFVLNKEILPSATNGGEPIIHYNLKPQFELLRYQETNDKQGLYSLKDVLTYIDEHVFYNAVAKSGIKPGAVGERIFAAMKEAFSQFRLLQKNFDDAALQALLNPGGATIEVDADGKPAKDYIGEYLDSQLGNETAPLKAAPILYAHVLKLTQALYSEKYVDNSSRFVFNNKGQLLDKAGALSYKAGQVVSPEHVYSFSVDGTFVNSQGKKFDEMSDPITDPSGKLLAAAASFEPGLGMDISRSNFSAKVKIPSLGNPDDLARIKKEIMDVDNLPDEQRDAMLSLIDSLTPGANGQVDFTAIKRVVEGTQENIYFVFRGKNAKQIFGGDSRMSVDIKRKIMFALDRFIDGHSKILDYVVNAREILNELEVETVTPPFTDLKEELTKNFKFTANFKEEDMHTLLRKIGVRAGYENSEWVRTMLIELYDFLGSKATFTILPDGVIDLQVKEQVSAAIYNKPDLMNTIVRLKETLFTSKLAAGQISIADKYDKILDDAIGQYFAASTSKGGFKKVLQTLGLFKDDGLPKDWNKADSPVEWFVGVQPLPGDGGAAAMERNDYERGMAWNNDVPKYLLRLLTTEQQMLRVNLLGYVNAALNKSQSTFSSIGILAKLPKVRR